VRTLLVIALLAGCGRVGFDGAAEVRSDAGGDGPDVPGDADLSALLEGCVLGLAMDETSWAGGVIDRCGGDNNGTAIGGAVPVMDAERGRVGELFGGADCVVVPDAPALRGGSAFTTSAWVRPVAFTAQGFGVISKRSDLGVKSAYSVFLWASDFGAGSVNHVYVDVDTEDERFENTLGEFLGAWHQITVVFDGARASAERVAIYVDGAFTTFAPESASSVPVPATPPDVSVGCLPLGAPAQALVGRIDDVMLWDRALAAGDVTRWYEATR